MKRVIRMIVFSAIAFYGTLFWNKGITFDYTTVRLIVAPLVIAGLYYLIRPIARIVLLPINFITFGLVSFIVNLILLVFLAQYFHVFTISAWTFGGATIGPVTLPSIQIGYWMNVALISLSISVIINLLETLL